METHTIIIDTNSKSNSNTNTSQIRCALCFLQQLGCCVCVCFFAATFKLLSTFARFLQMCTNLRIVKGNRTKAKMKKKHTDTRFQNTEVEI